MKGIIARLTRNLSALFLLHFFIFIVPHPAHLNAAASRANRGITIDGTVPEWNMDELVYEDSSNDSSYGTQDELEKLFVSWDNSNFYMAVTGIDKDKALVVYIATGSGGVSDASLVMNTGGTADNAGYNWWWGAKHKFPSDFTPQFQWNSYGMRVDPADASHGFFHYEGSPPRGVLKVVSQALSQSAQPGYGAMEIAIPWTTLFEGITSPAGSPTGIPSGAAIKILACLKDGEGKSTRETIPNQSGTFSSDGSSFFTFDTFLTVPVALATGTPLYNISPVPRNLQAVAGPQQVSLSWNKRGAFENYLRYYSLERSSDNFVAVTTFTTSGTYYSDSGLQNSLTYYYRLRALYDLPGQGLVASGGASETKSAVPAGPKVAHSSVSQFAYPGQVLKLAANIPAPSGENLTLLRLYWRHKGGSGFSDFISTKTRSGDNYTFEISSNDVNSPGIDYYIDARSNSGITLLPSGAPANYYTVTVLESITQTVDPSQETLITLPGDSSSGSGETSLLVPAFSIAAPTLITIQSKSIADLIADRQDIFTMTPEVTNGEPAAVYDIHALDNAGNKISASFSKKATLTLRYMQSAADELGLDVSRLRIYRWSGTNWVKLGGTVNVQNQTVTVQVDHLSRYALFETNPASLATDAATELKQVVRSSFFPHLGEVLEFVVENPPYGLQLDIFTVKGSPVRSMTDSLIWNGKNDAGDIVESGLYIYQLHLGGKKISGSCVVIR